MNIKNLNNTVMLNEAPKNDYIQPIIEFDAAKKKLDLPSHEVKIASFDGNFDFIGWTAEQIFKFLAIVVMSGYVALNENTPKFINALKALGVSSFNNCKTASDILITLIQKGPKAAAQGHPKVEAFLNKLLKNPEIKKFVNQYKSGQKPYAMPVSSKTMTSDEIREKELETELSDLCYRSKGSKGIYADKIWQLQKELAELRLKMGKGSGAPVCANSESS